MALKYLLQMHDITKKIALCCGMKCNVFVTLKKKIENCLPVSPLLLFGYKTNKPIKVFAK